MPGELKTVGRLRKVSGVTFAFAGEVYGHPVAVWEGASEMTVKEFPSMKEMADIINRNKMAPTIRRKPSDTHDTPPLEGLFKEE